MHCTSLRYNWQRHPPSQVQGAIQWWSNLPATENSQVASCDLLCHISRISKFQQPVTSNLPEFVELLTSPSSRRTSSKSAVPLVSASFNSSAHSSRIDGCGCEKIQGFPNIIDVHSFFFSWFCNVLLYF